MHLLLLLICSNPVFAETIEDLDLEALLDQEIRAGEMGSFGQRLSEYGIAVDIHGYLSVEAKGIPMPWYTDADEQVWTFDLHHQVLNIPVKIGDRLQAETQIEWEHAGQSFYVPLAQIDLKLAEPLIVRTGFFVAPIGAFNEYQYPDFLRKAAQQPMWTREVVPSLWSEVGVQLRGKLSFANGGNINYAVFTSNGLELRDSDSDDEIIPEGGSIRDMRFHDRDKSDSNKAVGGRLGVAPFDGLDLGASGYTGAYTVDGQRQLSILDLDLTFRREALLVRAEGAVALQEITNGQLQKSGGYAMVAYRVSPALEPYGWVETIDLDDGEGRTLGWLGGAGIYPDPVAIPSLVLKVEVSTFTTNSGVVSGQGMSQLAFSF
jgi:hypothetical protein